MAREVVLRALPSAHKKEGKETVDGRLMDGDVL